MTRFRRRLLAVAPARRDAWVDRVLGLGELPDDGHDLPRGGVPYLPSPVEAVLALVARAPVREGDVLVDVGSGLGRTLVLVHLLTGARAIGIEVQARLASDANRLAERLGLDGVRTLQGDAVELVGSLAAGTVYYFYCPFDAARLERSVEALRPREGSVRAAFLDLPVPARRWIQVDPAGPEDRLALATITGP